MSTQALQLLAQTYDYSYEYSTTSDGLSDTAAAGIGLGFIIAYFVFLILIYVVSSLLLAKIFKKADVEGWKAWVPIYNTWTFLEIGGQQGFWAVLMLLPIVNIIAIIFVYIAMYHIGISLGKSGVFVLLGLFLPIVWYAWLALDGSTWVGKGQGSTPQATPAYAPPTNPIQ